MLEIRSLTKRYGTVTALDGATFEARPGRLVGFLGPNGAGKTTTMRCIFGLATPDSGDVRWDGSAIDAATRLRFGYMPEQRGLYPRMRVAGPARLLRPAPRAVVARRATRRPARGSSGSGSPTARSPSSRTSRTATSSASSSRRALVHDPELLVLDEPFSGLDPLGIATMADVLRERAARRRRRRVLVAPARPRRGGLRGRGDHQPRRGRRRGRHRGAQGRAPGAGTSRSRSRGPAAPGSPGTNHHTVLERDGDRVKLLVDETVDLDALLAAARRAGEVRRFSYEPPKLSELFMEAVTAPQPVREEAVR